MTTQNPAAGNQPQDDNAFEDAFAEFAGAGQGDPADREPPAPEDHDELEDAPLGDDEPGQDDLTARLQLLESENQRLKHSEASQRGRLGAYQRQINDLQRQLQEHASSKPVDQNGAPASDDAQRQDMAESMGLDDWESFKQDYPDLARAFEARLSADRQHQARLEQRLNELQNAVQPIQQQAHEQHLQGEFARLEARHADWREVVNAPTYQQWLQTQPEGIQQLASSDSADDASALLDLYKAVNGAPQGNSRADAHDKRQQRLAAAQSVPRRGASPRDGVADDFEAAFNHYANRKR